MKIINEYLTVMNALETKIYYNGGNLSEAHTARDCSGELFIVLQHLRHIRNPNGGKEFIEIEEQYWNRDSLDSSFDKIDKNIVQTGLVGEKSIFNFLNQCERINNQTA